MNFSKKVKNAFLKIVTGFCVYLLLAGLCVNPDDISFGYLLMIILAGMWVFLFVIANK